MSFLGYNKNLLSNHLSLSRSLLLLSSLTIGIRAMVSTRQTPLPSLYETNSPAPSPDLPPTSTSSPPPLPLLPSPLSPLLTPLTPSPASSPPSPLAATLSSFTSKRKWPLSTTSAAWSPPPPTSSPNALLTLTPPSPSCNKPSPPRPYPGTPKIHHPNRPLPTPANATPTPSTTFYGTSRNTSPTLTSPPMRAASAWPPLSSWVPPSCGGAGAAPTLPNLGTSPGTGFAPPWLPSFTLPTVPSPLGRPSPTYDKPDPPKSTSPPSPPYSLASKASPPSRPTFSSSKDSSTGRAKKSTAGAPPTSSQRPASLSRSKILAGSLLQNHHYLLPTRHTRTPLHQNCSPPPPRIVRLRTPPPSLHLQPTRHGVLHLRGPPLALQMPPKASL